MCIRDRVLEKEEDNQLTSELRRQLDLDGVSRSHMEQVEETMRKMMAQINERNIRLEADLRKREEEIFSLKNLNTQLKAEIETHKEMKKQLKDDYSELLQRKGEGDVEIQRLTNKIYSEEINTHKLVQENERLARAVNSLNDAKEAMDVSIEEIKQENIELKQILTDLDREKNLLASKLEKARRDSQTLEIALRKAENTIGLQMKAISELQKDYHTIVEREKSSLPAPEFFTAQEVAESRKKSIEMDSLKSRYEEYKQRQNKSTLGDVFKWEEPKPNVKPENTEVSLGRKMLMAPAKNVIVGMPSDRKFEENKDQIGKFQNSLQMLLTEKQKLEKEYSKFGLRTEKSIAQKKRKEELEFELDLNEKNIQRTKFKLRELNALCLYLFLSLIHICRCRRYAVCRSRWSPYH
eukprot:TRINITY_DN10916_c0_g1_i20.p1 TRINITY_DN10916_c0_g1~~TRINITY_DN10916_c0_g1_i20.p1  ORF type:complete len:409 (+),score=165.54 TRINITY_DN10916_c0_g1_i20:73-1299(+)